MILLFIFLYYILPSFAQQIDLNNNLMLAESYEQNGELEKAKNIYENLYQSDPTNFIFFDALNRVLIQLKEYDYSIKIIGERLASAPQDINLYGLLGKSYYLEGNESKAFEVWESAFEKVPQNESTYRIIANYAIERRAFEKAIEYLEMGKSKSEDKFIFSYDLANIYALTMQYTEAAEEYCYILSLNPNQLSNIEVRILSYINKPEALDKTIEALKNCVNGEDISYKYLLARLYLENKSYEEAFNIYLEVDEQLNNQGIELYNFAQLLFSEGEYSFASKTYQKIIENYPDSPLLSSAKLGYAKTMEESLKKEIVNQLPLWKPYYKSQSFSSDKASAIISAYNELIKLYPNSDIKDEANFRIGVINYHIENKPDEAENYFKLIIEKNPASKFTGLANEQLGKIYLEKGDLDAALDYFTKAARDRGNTEEKRNSAKYMMARLNFYNKNFENTLKILNEILNNLKDNMANDALELSLILNTKMNDSLNIVKFAEAEFLAERKKFDEAINIYREISEDKKSLLLKYLCKYREAQMELALDDYETSLGILSIIAEESESDIYSDKALYLQGKIYQFGINNIPKAIETYEKLLAKFPNSLYLDEAREEIIKLRNKLS